MLKKVISNKRYLFFFFLCLSAASRGGQLAPRRPTGQPLPGAELPAAELRAAAAPPGDGHAGGPAPLPAGGSAAGEVGRQQRGSLLGDQQRVRSNRVVLLHCPTLLPDVLELVVAGPQIRTGPCKEGWEDQVALKDRQTERERNG